MKALRHFYRCEDCLTIAVTAAYIEPTRDRRGYPHWAECGACGGEVEYMGPVTKHHVLKMEWHAACDGRCTNATGPSCDCQCGGEHHGTGAMVEVIVRAEGLPRLMNPPEATVKAQAYRAIAQTFESAWDARYAAVTQEKRERHIGPDAFRRYMDGQDMRRQFAKARSLRTHSGRNKRIAALTESLSPSEVSA